VYVRCLHNAQNPVAEIRYWRDVSSILSAMQNELNNTQIGKLVTFMKEHKCAEIVGEFEIHRQQVLSGALEAKTNYEALKLIELPFSTLTKSSGLTNTPLLFPGMMSTLQTLYTKSAFYKESRLISLLEKIGTNTDAYRIVNAILSTVEQQICLKEMFTNLYESKGKAKKVGIRIAQTHMIIDIISQNMFVKEWLVKKSQGEFEKEAKGMLIIIIL